MTKRKRGMATTTRCQHFCRFSLKTTKPNTTINHALYIDNGSSKMWLVVVFLFFSFWNYRFLRFIAVSSPAAVFLSFYPKNSKLQPTNQPMHFIVTTGSRACGWLLCFSCCQLAILHFELHHCRSFWDWWLNMILSQDWPSTTGPRHQSGPGNS